MSVGDALSDLLLLRALLLCQFVSQLSERDLSIRVMLDDFGDIWMIRVIWDDLE